MEDVNGILLNDQHGLAMKAEGTFTPIANDHRNGFYTSLMDKASQLPNNDNNEINIPTIRIETTSETKLLTSFINQMGEKQTIIISKPRSKIPYEN